MKDYFTSAEQSDTKTTTIGAWKRNSSFAALTGDLASKISSNDADSYLEKSLHDINIT